MRRPLFAAGFGAIALLVAAASGLAAIWLAAGTALAAGFGWMLGGLPSGASRPESHTGNGPDGGSDGGGGGGG